MVIITFYWLIGEKLSIALVPRLIFQAAASIGQMRPLQAPHVTSQSGVGGHFCFSSIGLWFDD